jgi:hypothetical protein
MESEPISETSAVPSQLLQAARQHHFTAPTERTASKGRPAMAN